MKKIMIFLIFILVNIEILSANTNIIIKHTPITKFSYPGEKISFRTIVITSNCAVSNIYLLYRIAGEYNFLTNSMKTNGSTTNYIFSLTNSDKTKNNLEYFILVYDNYGNIYRNPLKSDGYYLININGEEIGKIESEKGGKIELADDIPEDDKITEVEVPEGAIFFDETFGIEFFTYSSISTYLEENNMLVLNNEYIENFENPVALYYFYKYENGEKESYSFRKDVTIKLRYFDENNDGKEDNTLIDENSLRIFYWDGLKWRYQKASQDVINNTFTFTTSHLSFYGIFGIKNSIYEYNTESKILDYVSNPSFSPLDGDIVLFGIKKDITDYTIKIFNFNGKLIRTLKVNSWDGRDEDGKIVESGVYIYEIISDNIKITGMVNIIK